MASTGAQLLTTAGTNVENPKPTGNQPSRSFWVKAAWLSCRLWMCGGILLCGLVGVVAEVGDFGLHLAAVLYSNWLS